VASAAAEEEPPPTALDRYGRDEDGLTLKARRFVEEFAKDWNGTQAAIRAGYSPKSAKDSAYELIRKPAIAEAITKQAARLSVKSEIDRQWVLSRLVDVHSKAEAIPGVGGLDRRLKALELIGRHVDVAAWRMGLSGEVPPGAVGRAWDLTRLDDEEIEVFERLLTKISIDRGGESGAGGEDDAPGPGEDQPSQG
jgi:phage terminase small subunit